MTERKCACNKLFSILVRGPNTEADEKSAYNNVQVGVWAPIQRISKRNSTGNASWGGTTK
ncbi:nitrogen fixation protein NifR [Staphylococcus aureus]